MQEVIALEEDIRQALIDDRVPDSVLPWAHDILCNGWAETDCTRLSRLQTIVATINSQRAPRCSA